MKSRTPAKLFRIGKLRKVHDDDVGSGVRPAATRSSDAHYQAANSFRSEASRAGGARTRARLRRRRDCGQRAVCDRQPRPHASAKSRTHEQRLARTTDARSASDQPVDTFARNGRHLRRGPRRRPLSPPSKFLSCHEHAWRDDFKHVTGTVNKTKRFTKPSTTQLVQSCPPRTRRFPNLSPDGGRGASHTTTAQVHSLSRNFLATWNEMTLINDRHDMKRRPTKRSLSLLTERTIVVKVVEHPGTD
ncbi:uncharacterized protein LOC133405363 [Phycodurus eques]|uniref:uncharacterized protein LOC133405363 n=1 Tax=Phycodurus eques TaxID=693459 RepID=UPI002ACD8AA1|nr:uncharacterized protein LOC133405363 [Phycodurus eques]